MLASDIRNGTVSDSALRRRVRARQAREIRNRERRRSTFRSARWLSGILLLCIVALLLLFTFSPAYYVRAITLEGVSYFSNEEMLGLLDVSMTNIFWLDEAAIRDRLLRQPGIAAAEVSLGWPVGSLHIHVTERVPSFVWQIGEQAVWVSEDGQVMPKYHSHADLPLVRSLASDELPLAYNAQFAPAMVADVLAMLKLMPTVDALLFDPHPSRGIGYWHGEDTLVWYGRGGDFAQKHSIVQAIAAAAVQDGEQLAEINVAQPLSLYYRALVGD